jgi:hypothetical protein
MAFKPHLIVRNISGLKGYQTSTVQVLEHRINLLFLFTSPNPVPNQCHHFSRASFKL